MKRSGTSCYPYVQLFNLGDVPDRRNKIEVSLTNETMFTWMMCSNSLSICLETAPAAEKVFPMRIRLSGAQERKEDSDFANTNPM